MLKPSSAQGMRKATLKNWSWTGEMRAKVKLDILARRRRTLISWYGISYQWINLGWSFSGPFALVRYWNFSSFMYTTTWICVRSICRYEGEFSSSMSTSNRFLDNLQKVQVGAQISTEWKAFASTVCTYNTLNIPNLTQVRRYLKRFIDYLQGCRSIWANWITI